MKNFLGVLKNVFITDGGILLMSIWVRNEWTGDNYARHNKVKLWHNKIVMNEKFEKLFPLFFFTLN